jgi:general secretion pathway protein F
MLLATRGTGALVHQFGTARFTTTLATLLDAQVPLVDALQAAASATSNLALRARLDDVIEKVRQGMSLHRAMVEAQVFPPMVLAMVASGEGSGQLARAVGHAAQEQTRGIEARVKTAVALFEPGILLVMGGLVTVIVLSILLPIVSLNDLVGG